LKRHRWTAAERQERRERAVWLRLVRHMRKGYAKRLGKHARRAEAVTCSKQCPTPS
jgi:hypothetical protein